MADKTTKEVEVKISTPGAAQAQGQLKGLGAVLKELNQAGSAAGITGQSGLVGLLKGAGIAGAATLGANAIRSAADAWREYAAGTLQAHEAILKMAGGIPILGSFIEAGNALGQVYLDWLGRRNQEKYAPGEGPKFGPYTPEEQRAKEMAESGAALRSSQGLRNPSVAAPVFNELGDTIKQIRDYREKAITAATDAAKINYQISADNMEEVLKQNRENVKTALLNFASNFAEGMIPVRKAIFDEGKKAIEAEEQARYDEAQKAAELVWDNFIAAQRELGPAREAPNVTLQGQGIRFTAGYGAGEGNSPEAQTAKNTAETNKKQDELIAVMRDIANAINRDSSQIIYLR